MLSLTFCHKRALNNGIKMQTLIKVPGNLKNFATSPTTYQPDYNTKLKFKNKVKSHSQHYKQCRATSAYTINTKLLRRRTKKHKRTWRRQKLVCEENLAFFDFTASLGRREGLGRSGERRKFGDNSPVSLCFSRDASMFRVSLPKHETAILARGSCVIKQSSCTELA